MGTGAETQWCAQPRSGSASCGSSRARQRQRPAGSGRTRAAHQKHSSLTFDMCSFNIRNVLQMRNTHHLPLRCVHSI